VPPRFGASSATDGGHTAKAEKMLRHTAKNLDRILVVFPVAETIAGPMAVPRVFL
jgi:hypothetical protein